MSDTFFQLIEVGAAANGQQNIFEVVIWTNIAVLIADFTAQPAKVRRIDEPAGLWPRDPPIRYRAAIPTSWLEIRISEGKNRQVRRMTAAIGYPTLRLIRAAIGAATLDGLAPGKWRQIDGSYQELQGNLNE